MAYDRIATVKPIEENEASDLVAGIYADIKQTKMIDFVPAFCAHDCNKSRPAPSCMDELESPHASRNS